MLQLALTQLGLFAYLLACSSATALTYKLTPNEKACFFTDVKQEGAKIAFYFAVRLHLKPHPSATRQLKLNSFCMV